MRGRLEVWGGSLVLKGVRDFGSYKNGHKNTRDDAIII